MSEQVNYVSILQYAVESLKAEGRHNQAGILIDVATAFAELQAENARLREFAKAMIELADWPEGGDIDGFDFQDAAVKHGILIPEQRSEPCGEDCACNSYYGDNEWKDGIACYQIAAALSGDAS